MKLKFNYFVLSMLFFGQLFWVQIFYFFGGLPVVLFMALLISLSILVTMFLNGRYLFKVSFAFKVYLWFVFYILCSYFFYAESVAAREKLFIFFYSVLIPSLLVVLNSKYIFRMFAEANFLFFFSVFSGLTIWFTFLLFLAGEVKYFPGGRLMGVGLDNPIWFGRLLSVSIIAVLLFARFSLLKVVTISIGLYLVFLSGTRAVWLGLLLVFLLVGYQTISFPLLRKLYCYIFFLGVLSLAYFLIFNDIVGNVASVNIRLKYWMSGLNIFLLNPWFGVGFGDYGISTGLATDLYAYPHNSYIEILSELGVIGAVLYTVFLTAVLRDIKFDCFLSLVFVFMLFNCMFSGDLASNNHMVWFGLAVSAKMLYFRESGNEKSIDYRNNGSGRFVSS